MFCVKLQIMGSGKKMVTKKSGIMFLLGIGICKYFDNKVSIEKEAGIERNNLFIQTLDRWMTLRDNGISIERYLRKLNCKKVAIYGLGKIGNHLYEELRRTQIEIVGIDRADIYNNYQMPVYKPDDCFEDIDLIIVTSFEYEVIFQKLREKYTGKIVSFQQLLSACEEFLF